MIDAVPWVYWIGFIATAAILHFRVGFPDVKREHGVDWREFLLGNLHWFALNLMKIWAWPITAVAWLVQGRKGPTWRAVAEIDGRPVRRIVRVRSDRSSAYADFPETT